MYSKVNTDMNFVEREKEVEQFWKEDNTFKNIVAQYSKVKPEEMTGEMRFREDLGFTSLDFMSFLGELEDTFDIELEETEVTQITTLEEALKLLEELQ